jgi:hypothetical protein
MNGFDVENNVYETSILAYSRKLGLVVLASCIIRSNVEEEKSPPYIEDAMTNLEEKMMNSKDTTSTTTPQWVPTN